MRGPIRWIVALLLLVVMTTPVRPVEADSLVRLEQLEWYFANPGLAGIRFYDVAEGNGMYVATATRGHVATSPDGGNWTLHKIAPTFSLGRIAFGAGKFVAASMGDLSVSEDGVNWRALEVCRKITCTTILSSAGTRFNDITFVNGQFVVVGEPGVLVSRDGVHWEKPAITGVDVYSEFESLAYGNGRYVATAVNREIVDKEPLGGAISVGTMAERPEIYTSADGLKWNKVPFEASPGLLLGPYFINGQFFVTARDAILTSRTGLEWTKHPLSAELAKQQLFNRSLVHDGHRYVFFGSDETSRHWVRYTSVDGKTWVLDTPPERALGKVIYSRGRFLSHGAAFWTSEDGVQWEQRVQRQASQFAGRLDGILYGEAGFVTFGDSGAILTSPDGVCWTKQTTPTTATLTDGVYGNGRYLIRSLRGDVLLTSTDARHWTRVEMPGLVGPMAYGDGLFVSEVYQRAQQGSFTMALLKSRDGLNWTKSLERKDIGVTGIAYGEDRFVVIGVDQGPDSDGRRGGHSGISTDGQTWQWKPLPDDPLGGFNMRVLNTFGYGNGRFVALASLTLISADGEEWQWAAPGVGGYKLRYIDGRIVSVGGQAKLGVSQYGTEWKDLRLPTADILTDIAQGSGRVVVVTSNGGILLSSYLNPAEAPDARFTVGCNMYEVQGVPLSMDVAPFIEADASYLPLRYLAHALGVPDEGIKWDPASRRVTLRKGTTVVQVTEGALTMTVNDRPQPIPVGPVIRQDRLFVPVRAVAEAFGYTVSWNPTARSFAFKFGDE